MIVRILGEGQYDVSDEAVTALNELDARVESSIEAGDEEAFDTALARAARRRARGRARRARPTRSTRPT